MMKLCAQPARIWSAVTCHRFCRFGDLSPKQGRVQRPGGVGRLAAFDGDKSPCRKRGQVHALQSRCDFTAPEERRASPMSHALGIDLGGSSIKAVAVTPEGRTLA